jgi:hypothetical protein
MKDNSFLSLPRQSSIRVAPATPYMVADSGPRRSPDRRPPPPEEYDMLVPPELRPSSAGSNTPVTIPANR